MSRLLVLFVVVGVVGCGGTNKEQELQQEKLLVELSKANATTLTALNEREQAIRALEKSNQDRSEQLARLKESLNNKERELAQREMQLEKDATALERQSEEVKATAMRNSNVREELNAKAADLENSLQKLRQKAEAERQKSEMERREQEKRQRPELLGRMERRKPDLDKLIALTVDLVLKAEPRLVRSDVRKQVLESFKFWGPQWAKIEEEDAFAHSAVETAINFYRQCLSDPNSLSSPLGTGTYTLRQWEKDYVEKHSQAEGH